MKIRRKYYATHIYNGAEELPFEFFGLGKSAAPAGFDLNVPPARNNNNVVADD